MSKLLKLSLCLTMCIATIGAKEVKFPEADPVVVFDFPANWNAEERGALQVQAADASILLMALAFPTENVQSAMDKMKSEFKNFLPEYQEKTAMNATPIEHNGFKMLMGEGTANIDNKNVQVRVIFLCADGSGKAAMIFMLSDDAAEQTHGETIKKIIGSLKPGK